MLYVGGFKPIMGDIGFNTWLTNMVGPSPNTTAAAQPITYENLTIGHTSSGYNANASLFNIFGYSPTSGGNIGLIIAGILAIAAIGVLLSGFSANFLVPLLILGVLVTLKYSSSR
jgi:hypothetical protein